MTYRIVITGLDRNGWLERSLASAESQEVPEDAEVVVQTVIDAEGMGAAHTRYRALEDGDPYGIVVLLDMDDYLAHPGVVKRVHEEYLKGADVTYGSYQFHNGELAWSQVPYPDGCDYRREAWRCAPLRTFRQSLFVADPNQFIMDGEWIRKCTDMALMIPILERSNNPVFIPDVLYVYDHKHGDQSRRRVTQDYAKRVNRWIRSR